MRTILTLLLYISPLLASDQIPAPEQTAPILLKGGDIYPVGGAPIKGGDILFERGKIRALGKNISAPLDAQVVDIKGKSVYPGLIHAYTNLGLSEVSSVRATNDFQETGYNNANVRAERAVNPDSEIIPVTRSNGIALAVTMPSGGTITGQAALLSLDGWTWEDMTFKSPLAMVINWPNMTINRNSTRSVTQQQESIDDNLKLLDDLLRDTRGYKAAMDAAINKGAPLPRFDTRLNAMLPVINRELPVWVLTNGIRQITAAIDWSVRQNLRLVIVGSNEIDQAAHLLKTYDIPVIIRSIHNLPSRRDAAYDEPFTLPLKLKQAGVPFCIAAFSFSGNQRNLPYQAAKAVSYGLDPDDALHAITLGAATILGVERRVGSLEEGKDATLIVTTGNPLEITTNVEKMYIQGREIDLNDKQKSLYRKYTERYRQLSTAR